MKSIQREIFFEVALNINLTNPINILHKGTSCRTLRQLVEEAKRERRARATHSLLVLAWHSRLHCWTVGLRLCTQTAHAQCRGASGRRTSRRKWRIYSGTTRERLTLLRLAITDMSTVNTAWDNGTKGQHSLNHMIR